MRKDRGHKQPRNRNNPEFPLRGVKCGHCGGNLSGGFVSGRNKKYAYYSCMNPSCSKAKSIRRESLENDFTEFLEKYTPDPILMEALGEALKIVSKKQSAENLIQTSKVERVCAKLEIEMEELLQLRVSGIIDDKTYLHESSKRKEKIRNLQAEGVILARSNPTPDSSAQFGLRLISEFPLTWKMLEPGELKALRRVLFPQNLQYMYPGFKTAELSPIYKVKAASGTDENRFVTSSGFEPEFSP
ncbi:zinc ribbon domain-containing protein [Candidatus Campbellbacteria bacterium]|nr:MAG: zinc ribbon domain-containing protein [Candidatus Campbellbacteria bacterium]